MLVLISVYLTISNKKQLNKGQDFFAVFDDPFYTYAIINQKND